MKFAFAGFRHVHINAMYELVKNLPEHDIVATFEDHEPTINHLKETSFAEISHQDYDMMLDESGCEIVAIGDYYGRRGEMIIKALKAGKHVISDKPICTSLEQLDVITILSRENNLKVGCMLDIRDHANFIGLRNIVQEGQIGDVSAITFGGQHPLMPGSRPGWYFEEGKHGGTINDIAIHAIDFIPWITGNSIKSINGARTWHSEFAKDFPDFNDAGQVMFSLTNGCGVMGDVSYFVPDSLGYSHPLYWRITLWGTKGVLETSWNQSNITIALNEDSELRYVDLPEATPGNYLCCFIDDINGNPQPDGLTTESVLKAARISLLMQEAADDNCCNIKI